MFLYVSIIVWVFPPTPLSQCQSPSCFSHTCPSSSWSQFHRSICGHSQTEQIDPKVQQKIIWTFSKKAKQRWSFIPPWGNQQLCKCAARQEASPVYQPLRLSSQRHPSLFPKPWYSSILCHSLVLRKPCHERPAKVQSPIDHRTNLHLSQSNPARSWISTFTF